VTPPAPFALALLLLGVAALKGPAQAQAPQDPLATLRSGHPRLICVAEDLERIRGLIERDELARQYRDQLVQQAERILTQPPVEHKLEGPRLLTQSRRCLDRVYTLGLVYRLGGDSRFAERARTELLAAAAFPDWNPNHFLDTAEMSHALAIGYDWLYDFLSPEDRAAIRAALVEKGLRPGEASYKGEERYGWWRTAHHNWNQVCNGGLTVAALAAADEEPELSRFILTEALKSVPLAMREYGPDGGWAEGPGYWDYATSYNVYMLAALQSALGTDFGLSDTPDFSDAGRFRIYFSGPIDLSFNYADAGAGVGRAPEMFWLARRFDRPIYAWQESSLPGRASADDLLWFDPRGEGPAASGYPLDACFRGIDVAFLCSAWEDRRAIFVGFKGGDNRANHSHLDLGTFVLDALGQRWALDLGGDNYNLPNYFGKDRWTYYRLRTEGHNTLVVDGENQEPSAKAPIIASASQPARAYAVADLSKAYTRKCSRVWRGMALLDRKHILIEDEIEAPAPVEVVWGMHTKAEVAIEGATARLTLGGETVVARILEPAEAAFEVLSANPPPPQAQQPDVRKLAVRLSGVTQARLAVLLTPLAPGVSADFAPAVEPLSQWVEQGKVQG
jgi:Heparinase II/III-like protein/Domain of unknown function (DUF4962)